MYVCNYEVIKISQIQRKENFFETSSYTITDKRQKPYCSNLDSKNFSNWFQPSDFFRRFLFCV